MDEASSDRLGTEDTMLGDSSVSPGAVCRMCSAPIEDEVNFCSECGAPVAGGAAPDPLIGQVVADRYRISSLLGRGGMGVVYRCEHTHMGKVMAIKLLHGQLARDPDVRLRFRREAQAASRLSHPNTVSIFDFGTSEGLMYLVMEFVAGEDLGRVLRVHGPLDPKRLALLAAQACGSLAEAHDAGIVHRDLKPENLLVSKLRDGRELVKLLDFGLAKLREGEERNEITNHGVLIGTPYYMAPEVIRAQAQDHRVDVYALGAVLYRSLTGVPAFPANSPVAVLTRTLTDELLPPSKRRPELKLPEEFDEIVMKCMRRTPAERYASVEEVREALTAFLERAGLSDSAVKQALRVSASPPSLIPPSKDGSKEKAAPVATRDDVEAFEAKLRRSRILGWTSFLFVLGAINVGGYFAWKQHRLALVGPQDAEVEPNNTPTQGTLVAPGREFHGQIGARISPDRGDVDFFRVGVIPPGRWKLRAELTPQPNIDTALELLQSGEVSAVSVASEAGVGRRDVLPGFRVVSGREYYLSVHERSGASTWPMENITDRYALRFELQPVNDNEEVEPDDREEVAMPLAEEGSVRGWIEHREDVDYWCMATQTRTHRVVLTPPEGLDLALVVVPRDGHGEQTVDAARDGGEERVELAMPSSGARGPCLVLRATREHIVQRGNAETPYQLRIE